MSPFSESREMVQARGPVGLLTPDDVATGFVHLRLSFGWRNLLPHKPTAMVGYYLITAIPEVVLATNHWRCCPSPPWIIRHRHWNSKSTFLFHYPIMLRRPLDARIWVQLQWEPFFRRRFLLCLCTSRNSKSAYTLQRPMWQYQAFGPAKAPIGSDHDYDERLFQVPHPSPHLFLSISMWPIWLSNIHKFPTVWKMALMVLS